MYGWINAVVAILRGYSIRILLIHCHFFLLCRSGLFLPSLADRQAHWGTALSLANFAKRPQDPDAPLSVSKRQDEIGFIQAETRAMQMTLAKTLQQRERLAVLGSAEAQVNHDLRGMLSTALLLSDLLENSDDPKVPKPHPCWPSPSKKRWSCARSLYVLSKAKHP